MTNLISPITENVEGYLAGINKIALNSDAKIFIGITENLAEKLNLNFPNVDITVYEKNSKKEEILNAMKTLLPSGKVIICRRPISFEEFNDLKNSSAQITYCENQKSGRIIKYLKDFWQLITKSIFGVKTFQGDNSLIAFDDDIAEVLSNAENFSFATRVDRWKGCSQDKVSAKGAPAKVEQNKKYNAMLMLAIFLPLAVGAILTTCLALFVKISIIAGLFLACFDFICLGIAFFCLLLLIFSLTIGQKNHKTAIEIVKENENEKS